MNLFNKSSKKAFTLIELLVVIAVLGVLAAGVLIAIDPVDKINSANDSKVQTDISALANAAEAYAVAHNGYYAKGDIAVANVTLQDQGEIKTPILPPNANYVYTYNSISAVPPANNSDFDNSCTTLCTGVVLSSVLKSKKFSGKYQRYESATGKTCQVAAGNIATNVCP